MNHLFKTENMKQTNFLKLTSIFLFLLFLAPSLMAQPEHEPSEKKKEKIEQLKIAFFTTELDLTTEEAEKFWPVYNEMAEKLKAERKTQRKTAKEINKNIETLSDTELTEKVTTIFDSEITEAEIKKEYNEKIAEIIGVKKATKLLSLEREFNRELLKKLKGNRPPPPEHRPGGHGPR